MKLQPDCIRSILLEIEKQPYNKPLDFSLLANSLADYSQEELTYTCLRMEEGNLIDISTFHGDDKTSVIFINHMTYSGHQFLAVIESETIWNKTKMLIAKLGVSSLYAISQIATGVLNESIKNLIPFSK